MKRLCRMTWQNIIHLGKYARPKASERARPYVLSHEIFLAADPSSGERSTIVGASLDHLAGYLDAANTTARYRLKVRNGFPRDLVQECLERRKIEPLDKAEIQEICKLAEFTEEWIAIEDIC